MIFKFMVGGDNEYSAQNGSICDNNILKMVIKMVRICRPK